MNNELIDELIDQELIEANKQYQAMFNSEHEAYAVLIEEIDEVFDEINKIAEVRLMLWENIKGNKNTKLILIELQKLSLKLIKESIQVAAMLKKYRNSIEK